MTKKKCPKSFSNEPISCLEGRCGWWVEIFDPEAHDEGGWIGECAILTIAKALKGRSN